MAAFLLADVAVADMQAYRDSGYIDTVPRIAAGFGGRYRARGGDMSVLEGDWSPRRMVIIEFPEMAALLDFYHSQDYAPWKAIRQRLTDSKLVAVDGLSTELLP